VSTLADRALLSRSADTNEYRLGPALIPMGAVAQRSFAALAHAKREAEHLAEEFAAQCIISMATGEELLIVGRAGIPREDSIRPLEGQRHPLSPPVGSSVLAWAGEGAIEAWLDRIGSELTEAERDHYRIAFDAVRRRGYAVGLRVDRLDDLYEIYTNADLYTPEGRRDIYSAMAALAHDDDYLPATDDLPPDARLSAVAVPVFGPDTSLLFAISLVPDGQSARNIPVLSRALMRSAEHVMEAIDGRRPSRGRTAQPASSAATEALAD
jgi:DNA-binding IclR family transcriptional regulator